jgi:hypothetical protein
LEMWSHEWSQIMILLFSASKVCYQLPIVPRAQREDCGDECNWASLGLSGLCSYIWKYSPLVLMQHWKKIANLLMDDFKPFPLGTINLCLLLLLQNYIYLLLIFFCC